MPGSAPKPAIAPLVDRATRYALGFSLDSVPDGTRHLAKLQVANMAAAVFASFAVAKEVPAPTTILGGREKMTLWPQGGRVGLGEGLFELFTRAMMLDYDDYLMAGHTGHSSVLIPLALAQEHHLSGRDVLQLLLMANELEARLGLSVMVGPVNGQMWAFLHAFGAAAIRAKVLGADFRLMRDALGLSLAFVQNLTGNAFFGADAKLLGAAFPAYWGLTAADAAVQGMRCYVDPLEGDGGFLAHYGAVGLSGAFDHDGFFTDTLSYKLYPGCAYIDSPVDATLDLRKAGVRAQAASRIEVFGNLFTTWMDTWGRRYCGGAAYARHALNFTIPYNVAVALLKGDLTPDDFTEEAVGRPDVWELAGKVSVRHDARLTGVLVKKGGEFLRFFDGHVRFPPLARILSQSRRYGSSRLSDLCSLLFPPPHPTSPEPFAMPMPAKVRITTGDGKVYERTVIYARGSCGRSLSHKTRAVERKFLAEAARVLPASQAREAWEAIGRLESLSSAEVQSLIKTLCVKNPRSSRWRKKRAAS